jgi:predicted RNase H-like HicB family nuclease
LVREDVTMTVKLSVICREQSNGSYYAECPELDGCYTQGDTYEDALQNLRALAVDIITDAPPEALPGFAGAHFLVSEMLVDV